MILIITIPLKPQITNSINAFLEDKLLVEIHVAIEFGESNAPFANIIPDIINNSINNAGVCIKLIKLFIIFYLSYNSF